MTIQLSDHFSYRKIIRFTLPSIFMLLFISLYGIVDGFFVSNYVGKTAFAAVNLIFPYVMLFGVTGFVFGVGGSALVAKTIGEGNKHRANFFFSLLTYICITCSIVLMCIGQVFLPSVAKLLGAEGEMLDLCITYGRIFLFGTPMLVLQYQFEPYMITAQKPKLNLWIVIAAGLTNMILDWLLIGVFGMGVKGAAIASVIGEAVGGIIPLIYFLCPNTSLLRLGKTRWYGGAVAQSCLNGLSEFVNNVALNVVSMIYNWQLMRMAGENGVAAYGVIMYVSFVFVGVFFGIVMGVSPVISYNYGADNKVELKSIGVKTVVVLEVAAAILTTAALLLSGSIAKLLVGYDSELMSMTIRAFALYSLSFLIAPLNIFASALFTSLNDGLVSGLIAFSRMLIFQTSAVIFLPMLLGLDGVWLAMLAAELLSLIVSSSFYFRKRSKYGY